MSNSMSLSHAEAYLQQLEQLSEEIEYTKYRLRNGLKHYRETVNPQTKIDLESSVAHFEKYILPILATRQVDDLVYIEGAKTLTLGIDGYWGAYEFRQLFEGVDYLSKVFTIQTKLERGAPDFRLRQGITRLPVYRGARLYYYLSPREELRVRQIKFSSPGLVSFEGVGEVIKELRETFDYVITAVWVKRLIDIYRENVRERDTRKLEEDIRRIQSETTKFEVEAKRDEALLRRIEARSKLKMAIHQLREHDIKRQIPETNKAGLGIGKLEKLADTAISLEVNGLAYLPKVEDEIVSALSVLHRLNYEGQKVKIGIPPEEKQVIIGK